MLGGDRENCMEELPEKGLCLAILGRDGVWLELRREKSWGGGRSGAMGTHEHFKAREIHSLT